MGGLNSEAVRNNVIQHTFGEAVTLVNKLYNKRFSRTGAVSPLLGMLVYCMWRQHCWEKFQVLDRWVQLQ